METQNNFLTWDYIPKKEKEDPYEGILPEINNLIQDFETKTKDEQNKIIDKVLELIRNINIYPIFYFNREGVSKEIKSVIDKNDVCFIGDELNSQARNGLLLLDFLFPNLHKAYTCNLSDSMYDRFFDDKILKFCLNRYIIKNKKILNMRTPFFSAGRFYYDTPINFSPMRAKAIFEKFCPPNGIIYDYSMGYGGRMLGALASKQNFIYTGTDPNRETFYNLKKLGKYIEEETGRTNSYKIFNLTSEQLQLEKNSIDLAFSCPPFFNKEIYSLEDTQSIMNYPVYGDWLEGYVRPTIKNCYNALKDDGVFIFDILNYTLGRKKIPLVDDWKRIAEEEGFIFKKEYPILSRFRKKNDENKEKLYVFKKNDSELVDYTPSNILILTQRRIEKQNRAKDRRKNYTIVEYDAFGNMLQTFNSYDDMNVDKSILNNKKPYNDKYYRIFRGDDLVCSKLDVKPPICSIDNNYFYTYVAASKYVGVSRQAVQSARKRKAKKINNYDVIWF